MDTRFGTVLMTPLKGRTLFFRSLSGDESIGGLFEYNVQFLSTDSNIKLNDVLGEYMTVTILLTSGKMRFWNGVITRFTRVGQHGSLFLYRAVLHPWLWFLSRNADCRIFQNHSVPEVVEKIFLKYAIHNRTPLQEPYDKRPYTVQYRETDLNFVHRLLESEGIAYHFVHEADKHTMVMTNSSAGHEAAPGYATIHLREPTESGQLECLTSWTSTQNIEPAEHTLNDYDYTKANAVLRAYANSESRTGLHFEGEIYDYPGKYDNDAQRDKEATRRLNQMQSYAETIEAQGTVRGIGVGNVFSLEGPLSVEGTRQFLVIKAHYEIRGHAPETQGDEGKENSFHCAITVVDSKPPFYPARVTPTPIVQGPQTATVVGPTKNERADKGGPEIWTDPLGRVLVNFHWERLGPLKATGLGRNEPDDVKDETNNTIWLRVAQLWAGSGWGTVFIPRIGQEVMVEFLEGDPDRPIVTGRLYNSSNKPAYVGDEKKRTQSGIRTQSTPDGNQKMFNEIRFEDKKDAEEVYIQAQKDQLNHVKHNRTASVGADDAISVGGDRNVHVKGNLSITVDGGGKGEYHSSHKVTGCYHYEATDKIFIEAPNEIKLKCGDSTIVMLPGSIKITAGGKATILVDANVTAESSVHTQMKLDADAHIHASTGADMLLNANATITSKDKSKLTLDGNAVLDTPGDATVHGKNSKLHGDTSAVVDAHGNVTADSGGVTVTGTQIKLNG